MLKAEKVDATFIRIQNNFIVRLIYFLFQKLFHFANLLSTKILPGSIFNTGARRLASDVNCAVRRKCADRNC